ncbi:hypothetical protein G6L16_002160 [Agrobacterium tumefaciens]|uniref:hypothetical protein n=1 Tax=Agrobacterium tumefaciens TaxID=358 RepID=UPI001572B0DD|nr:hypothetical protein [Agrobacterium tumefaciens]NSZ62136.1 hypothetical protein [Agrobacterium tumefaciens]NTA68508.1 hypothetical protein [Agrobacterium tumefaciens]WIE38339.1 hypothetical protein G6L16_002160 [Agrobacterium tumefaciens]
MLLVAVSLATLIILALCAFQIVLAAGAPFGRFAWGGEHSVLPVAQRFTSVAAVTVYILAASFPLQKAGLITIWPAGWVEPGIWIIACTLAVNIGLNAMSRSRAERQVMTPVAAILFFTVSLS